MDQRPSGFVSPFQSGVLKDEGLVKDLQDVLAEFKKLSTEIEALVKDIKEHPKKYFKFSLF